MSLLRIVVADDMKNFTLEVKASLSTEPDFLVVGVAFNGQEAVQQVLETVPDVVLMDLEMPVMDGVEAIRRIRREAPTVEIVVLTIRESGDALFEALKAGAKGYLLKKSTSAEIADAVRRVAGGQTAIPPALVQIMWEEFERIKNQPQQILKLFDLLTPAEIRTLKCIGEWKTNSQIAQELCIELQTVKTHTTNILRKLEVNSRVKAALIAQKIGMT